MRIVTDGGEAADVGPGDLVFIEPGHDAWVLGDEPCVMLDFSGMAEYARRREVSEQAAAAAFTVKRGGRNARARR